MTLGWAGISAWSHPTANLCCLGSRKMVVLTHRGYETQQNTIVLKVNRCFALSHAHPTRIRRMIISWGCISARKHFAVPPTQFSLRRWMIYQYSQWWINIEDWLKIHRSFRRCMDQTFITVSVLITNSLMKAWRVSDSELRNTIKAWLWDMFGVPWTGLWECRTGSRLTVRSSTVWLVDMSFRGHQSWRNEPYSVPDESSGMKKNSEGAVADWVARRLTSSKKKWISIFHPCFVDLLEFHIGLAGPVNCVQSKYYYKLT